MKLNELRSEGRKILYVESNLKFKKFWQTDEVKGILADDSTKNRLIVFHTGSENVFVAGAQLTYKAGSMNSDYHGYMNSTILRNG